METKRNHYYQGKLLKSDDFSMEQAYLLDHLKDVVTQTQVFGKLQGLLLTQADQNHLCLSQGSAIDGDGNIIHLKKNQIFTLQECQGFESLDGYGGYITLGYQEEKSEDAVHSFHVHHTPEEYEYIQDGYQLFIETKQQPDPFLSIGFIETLLYEDQDVVIQRYLPRQLPRHGNIHFLLHVEQKQSMSGQLYYNMESSHYTLKQGWHPLKKQQSTWFSETLYRVPEVAGEQAVFRTKSLCIIKGKREITNNSADELYITFCEDIKETLRSLLYQTTCKLPKKVAIGYVEFSYLHDSFQILQVKNEEAYAITQKTNAFVERMLALYAIKQEETIQELQETSGTLHMMLQHREIWTSEELSHGLASNDVWFDLGWMIQPDHRNRTICFGNADLTVGEKEHFQYTIRSYPKKGTFQILVLPPTAMLHQQIKLRWIARCYPKSPLEPHLVALRPQFITLQPSQVCMFLPIFDQAATNALVSYQLEREQDGSIQSDGCYLAPTLPGLYQVKAIHNDEEALSYVKVVKPNET